MSSPAYVIGQFTIVDGLLALEASDKWRELTTIAAEMKIFRTRLPLNYTALLKRKTFAESEIPF